MKIEKIKISELKEYKKNAKLHPDWQIKQIVKSIEKFGFNDPIAIDEDNTIIEGHGRLLALKEMGATEVEVIKLTHLTEQQKKAYILAHNKLTMNTDYDIDILKEELEGLEFIDDIGFSLKEIEELFKEEEDLEVIEDEFDEDLVTTRCKKGDIWQLGEHRLTCGDSFSEVDIKKLIGEVKSDLCFLDPPYDLDKDEWVSNIKFNKNGAPVLLMAGDKQTIRLANLIPNFRQFIIHDREQAMLVNTSTPMSQHTIISLYCDHPSKYFVNHNDHFTSIIKCKKSYNSGTEDKLYSKMGKPVLVIAELFKHYTKKDDVILDLFGGGGSSIIACEQLGRRCYSNELLEEQCDIIISRWEQFTGKTATKIN